MNGKYFQENMSRYDNLFSGKTHFTVCGGRRIKKTCKAALLHLPAYLLSYLTFIENRLYVLAGTFFTFNEF